jgi:hypothetical protein
VADDKEGTYGLRVVDSSTNKSYSSPTGNTGAGRLIEGDGIATDDECDRQGVVFK